MEKKKILFIGGSLNQTTIVHQVAQHLQADFECWFSPLYYDGKLSLLVWLGLFDFTALGGEFRRLTLDYIRQNHLAHDEGGLLNDYDLVVVTTDFIIPNNVREKKIVLVQEGMTDPENFMLPLIRRFKLPPWLAGNTSTHGLSDAYDYFCVASEGYREQFIAKGVRPEKIIVTGIPNFDCIASYLSNDFPYRDYVLVATSDIRETLRRDDRRAFLQRCKEIAGDRQILFKLHPNENFTRASQEIRSMFPTAPILTDGDSHAMVANCAILITQFSSLAFVGLALGKKVYSYFDVEKLRTLLPIQNGGTSGKNIALLCRSMLEDASRLNKKEIL